MVKVLVVYARGIDVVEHVKIDLIVAMDYRAIIHAGAASDIRKGTSDEALDYILVEYVIVATRVGTIRREKSCLDAVKVNLSTPPASS